MENGKPSSKPFYAGASPWKDLAAGAAIGSAVLVTVCIVIAGIGFATGHNIFTLVGR